MASNTECYNKILRNIVSSKNELHIKTCSVMIGMFSMKYIDEKEPKVKELIESQEVSLREELDKQAVRLHLITL
jgi:hypothetical protein